MQYQFKFNTPKWFDTCVATSRYAWRSVKWLVKPHRCEKCNARLHTNKYGGDIELLNEHGYRSLMISNHGKHWCQKCVAEEVETVDGKAVGLSKYDKPKKGKCDCCGETKKKVWKFYETENIRLHFCMNWWNGFWICKDCILKTLKEGKVKTSYGTTDGFGKSWYVGSYGLYLKDGKVQLFRKTRY